MFLERYSTCCAKTCGIAFSTVAGRLMTALRSGVGCQTSSTALHTSSAYSGSVPVKDSGLYSKRYCAPASSASCFRRRAPSTAILQMSGLFLRNTCSRWATDVEL